MSYEKNEKNLGGDNSAQATLSGAESGKGLKATDAVNCFPDEDIKLALFSCGVDGKSPLYHFLGLYEVAKNYICYHEGIDECVRGNFNTLTLSMDFYLDLVKQTHEFDW
ncbi:MAG: hypothetical protein LBR81_04850 [Prevotellaceae bacterium]|jgi:hypothetical protein|nr:hypothetical protein [Prevotellaceae bacterium]